MIRFGATTAFLFALLSLAATAIAQSAGDGNTLRDGDPVAGRKLAEACEGCHGMDGIGLAPEFPNIAGQNYGYMVKQLIEMQVTAQRRAGREDSKHAEETHQFQSLARLNQRANRTMDPFVVDLSDRDIHDVSAYYAAQPCGGKTAKAADPTRPKPPAKIVRCDVCHGADGVTPNPTFPHLAGQKMEYLARQLFLMRHAGKADRAGGPRGRTSGIMGPQAENLNDDEIVTMAAWYAGAACRW